MNKSIVAISLCLLVVLFIIASTSAAKQAPPKQGPPKNLPPKQGSKKPAPTGTKKPAPTGTKKRNNSTSPSSSEVGTVTISGGYELKSVDNGRPVVLIAAALGVPEEVFRTAFKGVTPSKDGTPTSEEAQKNKAALLKVLAPYGVTNDRLDEVSNYYRYMSSKGQVWPRTSATAQGIIKNGDLTGVKITNAGSGYTSVPTVVVQGPKGKITATVKVIYTEDFDTNGSISSITI